MWLVFCIISMLICAAYELLGTEIMQSDEDYMTMKLKISVIGVEFIAGLVLYFLGAGESGLSPVKLILEHPLIVVATSFTVASGILYMWGLKFVGLSIQEALCGLIYQALSAKMAVDFCA